MEIFKSRQNLVSLWDFVCYDICFKIILYLSRGHVPWYVCMWWSEHNLWETFLFFYDVGPGAQTQVVRLGGN